MNNKRLMARMGNGLLREVRDSAEAEKIRRETGDEDMFVFYEDKHSRSRAEQPRSTWERPKASDSRKTTVNKQTLLQRGILPMEQNQAEAGLDTSWRTPGFNPHANKQSDRKATTLPPWAQTTVAIPKSKQTRGLPPGVKNTAADPGPLVGPLTGHAAASLNPDGSTQIRLLDQGADPAAKVEKGPKNKTNSSGPSDDITQQSLESTGFSWPLRFKPTVPTFPTGEDHNATRSDSGFKNEEPVWFNQSYSDEDKRLVEEVFMNDKYAKSPSTRLDMASLEHEDMTSDPGVQHVYQLYRDFKDGTGPETRVFGPHSLEVDRMKDASGVEEAREEFYQHNKDKTYDWKNPHSVDFGLPGVFKAGDDIVEQFVGGYNCYIIPNEKEQSLLFVLTNSTSNTSYKAHMADDFHRGDEPTPRGNMHQVFTWKEPMDMERVKKQ